MTDFSQLPDTLRLAQVARILGWSPTTIYRRLARKDMQPPPISYAGGRWQWRTADLQAYLQARDYRTPAKRKPLLTVPPAVRQATRAEVQAVAASLLKGA